jgi:hypothetical protein
LVFEFHTTAHNRITTHIRTRAILLTTSLCCAINHDDRTAGQTPTHGGSCCDSLVLAGWLLHSGLESALTDWHDGGGAESCRRLPLPDGVWACVAVRVGWVSIRLLMGPTDNWSLTRGGPKCWPRTLGGDGSPESRSKSKSVCETDTPVTTCRLSCCHGKRRIRQDLGYLPIAWCVGGFTSGKSEPIVNLCVVDIAFVIGEA